MKLVIDLGSTEFKAAVIADDFCILGRGGYKLSYQKSDLKVELAVQEAEKAFFSIVQDAVKSAGIDLKDITSLGLSSQAQTFTITDQIGVPLIPFLSWLDQRALNTCKEMNEDKIFADFANHSTINELSHGMQVCLLRNLIYTSPDIFSDDMKIMPLPTYIMFLLTGKYVTDFNIAAMTGLYSLKENEYWENALRYLRISQKNLPEVVDLGTEAARTGFQKFCGLPENIPVYSCGNDQTAGAYGADLDPGDILITLGTAQIAYCCCRNMPKPSTGLFRGVYPGGLFYAMFAENGGAIISQIIENIPEFRDFDTFAKYAETASGSSGIIFSVNDINNGFEWSETSANLADKARAIFVYLAKRIATMLADLEKLCDITGQIYLTGGGIKNKIWIKLIEKKLGRNFKIIDTSPSLGAAKMISKGL